MLKWSEDDVEMQAQWQSESGSKPPHRVLVADDRINADSAVRMACEGTALLWRGDFQNARMLLQALTRRLDRFSGKSAKKTAALQLTLSAAFHRHRQGMAQRAHSLGMLLIPFESDYVIPLRRAPDVALACAQAWGVRDQPCVASLRELQGVIGGFEWRRKGVPVSALGANIYPYYGVFAPIRSEYVHLVASAPLPKVDVAFDIGTGTGVLAAILAKKGMATVIATENDQRALECAQDNIERLGLTAQVEVVSADLFPAGKAGLIVCNPPWIPAQPSAPIERAIYDADGRMLKGFLTGLSDHLEPDGEGWLILSDIAEHLGLRSRAELLLDIKNAGLVVLGRNQIRPSHPKMRNVNDPLHTARSLEITSLWRLGIA